jgi:signal transduction histidine kinase
MEVQKVSDSIYFLVLIGTTGGLLLALSVVFFYIRYQKRFIQQQAEIQKAALEHKTNLLSSVIQSQETERIRISKELHDHVGSSLSSLRFLVSRITQAGTDATSLKEIAEESKAGIDNIIQDVRNISHSLSPAGLELWGFQEALEEYCEKMSHLSGLAIAVTDTSDGILKRLLFDDALSLFRVMQELLTNSIKHAAAKAVTISVDQKEGQITVKYTDDGIGMDSHIQFAAGIGMYNIESRLNMLQATYDIATAPGSGYNFIIKLRAEMLHKKPHNG